MLKSETLNLRVSPEFKRRLIEEAAKENRSVTNYVEATLTRLWEEPVSRQLPSRKAHGKAGR
jgi:predicted HicB family RNase H-like nuclease